MSKKQLNSQKSKNLLHELILDFNKKKTPSFTKLLYQENIISVVIANIIILIEKNINDQMINLSFTRKREIIFNSTIKINNSSIEELLGKKTLGQLNYKLKMFIDNDNIALKDLDKFIKLRNKITHKLFLEYKTLNEVNNDLIKSLVVSKKVMDELLLLFDQLTNNNSKIQQDTY